MVSTNGWPFLNVPACLLSVYPTHVNFAFLVKRNVVHLQHTTTLLIVASGAFTSTALNGYVHARDRTSGPGKLVSSTSKLTSNKSELHVTGSCEKPSKKSRRNTPTCSNFTRVLVVSFWYES